MSRWSNIALVLFWIMSMAWLGATKIAPTFRVGPQIGASRMYPYRNEGNEEVSWEIRWKDRPIGWATNRIENHPDGRQHIDSVVQFDDLPIAQIANELIGPLAAWMDPGATERQGHGLTMQVVTRIELTRLADDQRFETTVHLGQDRDLIRLSGTVSRGKLRLVAKVDGSFGHSSAAQSMRELYRGELDLPSRMSVADTLSPLPNLRDLRIGQSWTFQAYRPVPLGRPLQLVRAEVEGETMLYWNGQPCNVRHVVLRNADGTNPSAARQAIGQLWVQRDGTVLKQQLLFANLTLDFVRLPEARIGIEESK